MNVSVGTFFINGYNYDCAYDPKYVAMVQKSEQDLVADPDDP